MSRGGHKKITINKVGGESPLLTVSNPTYSSMNDTGETLNYSNTFAALTR